MEGYRYNVEKSHFDFSAVEAAIRAFNISFNQYNNGLVSYQRLLSTVETMTLREDAYAQTRGSIANQVVALYKALGGGWEPFSGQPIVNTLSQIDVASESLRSAKLNLGYTRIVAPVDGYVSNVDFQIGTQAVANSPILALVESSSFWVFGYFRESQIGKFDIGDKAQVTLMAYPDTPLQGSVESLGWGIAPSDGNTGVKLLPSIKPVFQWIRLAQRIPVRIKLEEIPDGVELRFGLTASVMVMAGK